MFDGTFESKKYKPKLLSRVLAISVVHANRATISISVPVVRVWNRPVDDVVPALVVVVQGVVVEVVPRAGLDLVAEPGDEGGRGRVPERQVRRRQAAPSQNPGLLRGIRKVTGLEDGVPQPPVVSDAGTVPDAANRCQDLEKGVVNT